MAGREKRQSPWDLDLTRGDWRLEAALGVNLGKPFAGIRLARYQRVTPIALEPIQLWEEPLLIIPSTPRTAMIAIGNVISGGMNLMHEEIATQNALSWREKYQARHRGK